MNAPARNQHQSEQRRNANQTRTVEQLQPSRMALSPAVASEFDLTAHQWRVLVDQIFPNAKTPEAIFMALSYCKARNLDILKKPVHIVPMWSSALNRMVETVWPGIAEIRTTATRTGDYGGIDEVEFGPMIEREFHGSVRGDNGWDKISKTVRFPEWASVVVYRFVRGQKSAFHTKIFWEETYASVGKTEVPNDMWGRRPRGQFDKCVEAAGLRKAFPEEVGNMYAAEEMEGRIIDAGPMTSTQKLSEPAAKLTPPKPPKPPAPPSAGISAAPFDLGAYLEEIETAFAGAKDEASVEEIWNDFDAPATLESEGHADMIDAALAIKTRRLAMLSPLNGG